MQIEVCLHENFKHEIACFHVFERVYLKLDMQVCLLIEGDIEKERIKKN
jgi:hypothetical protein